MGKMTGSASAEIAAPLERCYELAADVDHIVEWQDGVISVDVLERDNQGRALVAEIANDAKVRTIKTRVRFTYDEPSGLSWEQEKGEFKSLAGSWSFKSSGDTTTATYDLEIDPGMVLGMLVRGPVEGRVRELMVDARPGQLKVRAEQ
jgi:ribosome-associated toxin RatA of RatAB toxin-antitoxin module